LKLKADEVLAKDRQKISEPLKGFQQNEENDLQRRCPYRKPHPALKYLRLERAHPFCSIVRLILFSMVCLTFMVIVPALFLFIRSLIVHRTALAAENLALRQQLAVLNRKIHRPQLRRRDRFFWVILSQLWQDWRGCLDDCQTGDRHQMAQAGI
jgi:hypothetical protein